MPNSYTWQLRLHRGAVVIDKTVKWIKTQQLVPNAYSQTCKTEGHNSLYKWRQPRSSAFWEHQFFFNFPVPKIILVIDIRSSQVSAWIGNTVSLTRSVSRKYISSPLLLKDLRTIKTLCCIQSSSKTLENPLMDRPMRSYKTKVMLLCQR